MKIPSSQITPEHVYFSRRQFLTKVGLIAAGAGAAAGLSSLTACKPKKQLSDQSLAGLTSPTDTPINQVLPSPTSDLDVLTSYEDITNYTNFYEFTLSKSNVSNFTGKFITNNWRIEITGLVSNPFILDLDDMYKKFLISEHILRMRCVEGWSMVIPWDGFSLSNLLIEAEPTSSAKFVRFVTLHDPQQMPGQKNSMFSWPNEEGLRIDEAMNDLTLLATGIYGKSLLPQNGAPIRLVVPWKYGFKSIKSIVRIELVESMPRTFWAYTSPQEYGFYANVNPEVDHPRWSQRDEKRFGVTRRIPTQLFNGYADQVEPLYLGMDLRENY